jgi:hypothetical protein
MLDSHWSAGLPELTGTVEAIHEEDRGGSWEFDAVAIIKDDLGFHVVSSSGCSCPTHEEQAMHSSGPHATYAEALIQVPESHRDGFPAVYNA